MEQIKDVITDIINSLKAEEKTTPRNISDVWRKIAGEEIKKHTKPTYFKNSVLYVLVDEATWLYELSQKYKQGLLKRMNNEIGEEKVKNIFFKVGDI